MQYNVAGALHTLLAPIPLAPQTLILILLLMLTLAVQFLATPVWNTVIMQILVHFQYCILTLVASS